jgi:hypothetical protein
MPRTVFNRAAVCAFALLAFGSALWAQDGGNIVSSEISISRERAEIKLELDNGRKLTVATIAGASRALQRGGVPGDESVTLGVERGGAIDRSWRELLNRAMDAQTSELQPLLRAWESPAPGGAELDRALEAGLDGSAVAPPAPPAAVAPGMNDSVTRLQSKIELLQEELEEARGDAIAATRKGRGPDWFAPLRHVWRGVSGVFSLLVTFTVLFGIGFVTVMFGGRKYIEGVADTVRAGIGRAFLVGLAGSFLLLPVFVLGIIALAISIVGIPALIVWIPLFPLGAAAAVLLGYLAVAHAAGESWAERRYYGSEWFTRANSYYFMASGLALLGALFFAANVITMAGPWLGFINNILNFFGVILTWAAATIGFGAVLISRGGSRLGGGNAPLDSSVYSEANV